MPKNKLDQHLDQLNSLVQRNRYLFIIQPIFRKQSNDPKKTVFSVCPSAEEIYLNSKFPDQKPYIAFGEIWKSDILYSYSYKLVIPFFKFYYCFDAPGSSDYIKDFQFRYEIHPEITFYNKDHLHVLEKILPHYPTHKIDFEEFFEIINREFVKSNSIDFDYS